MARHHGQSITDGDSARGKKVADPYISGPTLDDVMRYAIMEVEGFGEHIVPSNGPCKELVGVMLEITNPRARLSRTETRGLPFSCLAELCWYLAKSDKVEFMNHYVKYQKYADGDVVYGAYGPRLFDWKGLNQFAGIINRLRNNPVSRKAVIQLFDACDITTKHNHVPCTCTLQFLVRGGKLHMVTYMRSNDLIMGFPHDVFAFTMMQEIIASALSVELGVYKHAVGGLHIYDSDVEKAKQFFDEGWQPTEIIMPSMPLGDPMPAIQTLVDAEAAIRNNTSLDGIGLETLDPYWMDLIRLLQIFTCSKHQVNDVDSIIRLRSEMSSPTYHPFIDKRLSACQKRIEEQRLGS